MLHYVYVVIFLNQIVENKGVVKHFKIGRREKDLKFIMEVPIVPITKL